MKTTNPKHSKIDVTPAGIPANEPCFLLRAGDVHAQAAVRFYADRVQAAGGDQNVISAARASISAFAAWPDKQEPTFDEPPVTPAVAAADLVPGVEGDSASDDSVVEDVSQSRRRRSRED